jgi:3'-phosphoadenosine 5'-phosphosulfate (PAPS) 3'-phosphatase
MTCVNLVAASLFILCCFAQSVISFVAPTTPSSAAARQLHKIIPMANLAAHSQDDMPRESKISNNNSGPLETLCSISLRACDLMTPLITSIYDELILSASSSGSDDVKKVKGDNSAFTIADGTVQRLLIKCLFSNVKFRDVVGEEEEEEGEGEEDDIIDDNWWYQVQGLTIPKHIQPLVDSTRLEIESLAKLLLVSNSNHAYYEKLTVFIDPIDGTREFTNGKGEQCSICIGFADEYGKAIAGVVYRPLSKPSPTWVAGAKSETYAAYYFGEMEERSMTSALLSTNGSISLFLESLIEELEVPRIKAGGAGNKMMMLLQQSISVANDGEESDTHHGHLYIQDRGVSRWDSCAAEACLEAFGGQLLKLTKFLGEEEDGYYTYLASKTNLDFIPNTANLTTYNSNLKDLPSPAQKAQDVCQVKAYSNLCGLVAFGKEFNTQDGRKYLQDAIRKAAAINPPSLD